MSLDPVYAKVLVDVVDCALKGSEFGVEAWKRFRLVLLKGRNPTLEEWNEIPELVDRALDDVKGPELRIDLEIGRIYA